MRTDLCVRWPAHWPDGLIERLRLQNFSFRNYLRRRPTPFTIGANWVVVVQPIKDWKHILLKWIECEIKSQTRSFAKWLRLQLDQLFNRQTAYSTVTWRQCIRFDSCRRKLDYDCTLSWCESNVINKSIRRHVSQWTTNQCKQPSYECRVRKSTSFTCFRAFNALLFQWEQLSCGRAVVVCLLHIQYAHFISINLADCMCWPVDTHTHSRRYTENEIYFYVCSVRQCLFVNIIESISTSSQSFVAENIPFAVKMKTRFRRHRLLARRPNERKSEKQKGV